MRTIRNSFGGLAVLAAAFFLGANFTLLASSYPSNTLWLSVASVSNGWVNLILNGTTPGTNYVLLSKQTLAAPSWSNAGTLTGATNQNWTPVSVPVGAQSSYFFQAQSAAGQTTSTNLWLEIPTNSLMTPGQLTAVIHNTQPDQFYDVLTNSSLAAPGLWNVQQSVFGAAGDSTTVQLPMNGPALFVRIRFGVDSTGSGIPDWWWLQYFGSVGGDPFAFDPAGDGLTLWQDYWEGLNPTVFHTPPAPQGLTFQADSTGTNVTLSWQANAGNVAYYEVDEDSSLIGTVPAGSSTTFSTTLGYVYFGTESLGPAFQVIAHYTNGATSAGAVVQMTPSSYPTLQAQVLRNSQGQLELITGYLPPDVTLIRLFWPTNFFTYQYAHYDVLPSDVVNGIYGLPNSLVGVFDAHTVFVEILHQSGGFDYANDFGAGMNGPDFVDATDWPTWINTSARYLKDNLHFLLRSATVNHSFSYDSSLYGSRSETGPAYEYSGYHYYDATTGELESDASRPMYENYLWRDFAYVSGDLDTGATVYNGGRYINSPEYQLSSTNLPPNAIPSLLLTDDTSAFYFYSDANVGSLSEVGLGVDANDRVYLPTGAQNLYGLQILAIKGDSGAEVDAGAPATLYSSDLGFYWYIGTASPSLAPVDYYFASQTPYDYYGFPLTPAPGIPGFSLTNTTPLLIAGMNGWPFSVIGWAKQAIQNGYNNKFAYLEQFFDQAYTKDANGVATTNSAGILSAYGEFYPMVPGPAALVTMPDIDPPYQRGTCTVYCASAQVDKNSDGNMDLSFNGPDATSQASPYRIWVNNWHTIPGTGGNLDYDKENPGYASPNYSAGKINCQRDLENFFRLWICGVPSLWLSWNYTFTLSFQNTRDNPAINVYLSCETNGGTGYLTDTNIAAQQVANGYEVNLGTVSNNCQCTIPSLLFAFGGTQHFLFEGAGIGSGQLTLTISRNGNVIAQTGVWLDLHDIKDFYERAAITNIYNETTSTWSSTIESLQQASSSALGSDTNLIVFVHGINVGGWDWLDDSDTVFKRLYWVGYRGKFAAVKWPCHFLTPPDVWDLDVFNYSELNAYRASTAMTAYLNQLRTRFPNYRLNILAHSQGNAVVSEAIKQGAPFDTYILTQGALPASAYDVNAPTNTSLVSQEVYHPTPEWQPMGYHGAYTNLPGSMVSFYNTNDTVLGYWTADQYAFKPADTYSYNGTYGLKFLDPGYRLVTDSQESRAMISRSRTWSIGAQRPSSGQMSQGVISSTVDLAGQFGFTKGTSEHSAQWTRPVQTSLLYYKQVLLQIQPTP
jgi:Alpha/beta hydrolase of unknown function (DUF900)